MRRGPRAPGKAAADTRREFEHPRRGVGLRVAASQNPGMESFIAAVRVDNATSAHMVSLRNGCPYGRHCEEVLP
jgi:hypothetical protein